MNDQKLREIQMDIRNNFGKIVDWTSLSFNHFNCYMFAVSCTVPTEIFDYVDECGDVHLLSLVGEWVPYFGAIGQFSGQVNFKNIPELIHALECDLSTLGICAVECSSQDIVPEGSVKIAFYYNICDLLHGKHSSFHFMRQNGDCWIHKIGWEDGIEIFDYPIENICFNNPDLSLVGYFMLSLKPYEINEN